MKTCRGEHSCKTSFKWQVDITLCRRNLSVVAEGIYSHKELANFIYLIDWVHYVLTWRTVLSLIASRCLISLFETADCSFSLLLCCSLFWFSFALLAVDRQTWNKVCGWWAWVVHASWPRKVHIAGILLIININILNVHIQISIG